MPLSWNEIRNKAHRFSHDWKDADSERSDAQTFWNEFFEVFGVPRKKVAVFEKQVEITRAGEKVKDGRIDAFWKGELLIEHKSSGKSLDKAFAQAADYFDGLPNRDLPRRILVSDFQNFRLYDLEEDSVEEFELSEFHKKVGLFGFIAGYQIHRSSAPEEAANIQAAEQLGRLHDQLKAAGYQGHALEVLLVRLLFCLFAEDTGIFEKSQFRDYLEVRTSEDGSDLGPLLTNLFQVLNTPIEARQKHIDEQAAAFAYINGKLFAETLPIAAFDRAMRETLLDAAGLDWSRISPAIFGSLFQSIMDKEARRNLGAHYTREANILKALRPLFLDALSKELEDIGQNSKRLVDFQKKLASIRILDPACGCGNFLVIAYRELRRLELEVLHRLHKKGLSSRTFDVKSLVYVDVDQFYGIEIEEFPEQIAQVALWLTDHQMNLEVSAEFGHYFARLPLTKTPNIVHANALQIAWEDVVQPRDLSFIVGNPPFSGAMVMGDEQRQDMARVFRGVKGAGILDYVCGWYVKAAHYLEADAPRGRIRCAFVSTNSISKGEQVGILWRTLLGLGLQIQFAHRTFQWSSEARGAAAVHCVIVGFGLVPIKPLRLFEYETPDGKPHEVSAAHINPYLVDGPDVLLENRSVPLCPVPPMRFGSMPRDGGNLVLTADERTELIDAEPAAAPFVMPYVGTDEFLYSTERYCLWLVDADPQLLRSLSRVRARVEATRKFRLASKAAATRKFAATPSLFCQIAQPDSDYLLVPGVSSERRQYIPVGFMPRTVVASNLVFVVPNASLYHFGIVSSSMHMAWVRYTCGRLESRYRYSKDIVYNNFPWPDATERQRAAIEAAAQTVLDARSMFPKSSLADMYDPGTMPAVLVQAHTALDRCVDAAYSRSSFKSEADRVAALFALYQQLATPIEAAASAPSPRRRTPKSKAAASSRPRSSTH